MSKKLKWAPQLGQAGGATNEDANLTKSPKHRHAAQRNEKTKE